MLPLQFLHAAPRWQQCVILELEVPNDCSALTKSQLPLPTYPTANLDLGVSSPCAKGL